MLVIFTEIPPMKSAVSVCVLGLLLHVSLIHAQVTLEPFASGFNHPVDLENAGDGSSRLFVVEQAGRILVIGQDGTVESQPFLDIRSKVDDEEGEEGLLGLAFHPDYSSNGFFFVYYTRTDGIRESVLERYQVDAMNPNQADGSSGHEVLTFVQPQGNHNGGDLNFGPEGNLYIGTGDGGSGNDPGERSQNLTLPLGKLLRINVDELPYTIPPDNPYHDASGDTVQAIWATGLRNPWRFSFDEQFNLWIADVGQRDREEINFVTMEGNVPGLNYGWDCREGDIACPGCNNDNCEGLTFVEPVYWYGPGPGLSVTGGYVMETAQYPSYSGQYVFADYVQNEIRILDLDSTSGGTITEILPARNISTFGKDEDGYIYAVSLSGTIFRLEDASSLTDANQVELNEELHFTMIPNPTSSQVLIEASMNSIKLVDIINIKGTLLHRQYIQPSKGDPILINTASFDRGLVLVRLQNQTSSRTQKLLLF